MNLFQIFVVMECVLDSNGKHLFKNKDLMAKFNAKTPKEFVKVLLLSGEIISLYGEISNLSGFGGNAIQEVKN